MPRIANTPVLGQADGPPWEFVVFVLVWGLLGLASFLFFHFNRNAALKRRILPPFVIIVGAMFLGVVYYFIGWQLPTTARVVDIACGKGEFLIRLVEAYGVRGVGVDLSPFFIADAARRLRAVCHRQESPSPKWMALISNPTSHTASL